VIQGWLTGRVDTSGDGEEGQDYTRSTKFFRRASVSSHCVEILKVTRARGQALLFQLPDALTGLPRAAHQAGVVHDAQVRGDRLPADVEALREACRP
jgi:hypothetical protein